MPAETIGWPLDGGADNAETRIRQGDVDLVVNIPKNYQAEELTNGYRIRRAAADSGVPLVTNMQLARRIVEALTRKKPEELVCKSWKQYLQKS